MAVDDLSLLPERYTAPAAGAALPLSDCSTGEHVAGECACGRNTAGEKCSTGGIQA